MLTKKQQLCIEMMISDEYNQKEIAEQINISESTICRWKKDQEFVDAYEKQVKANIQSLVPKAIKTQKKLLNARSEMVQYMASKDILDRAGYKPKEKVELSGKVNDPFDELSTDDLKKLIDDD